MKTMLLEDYIKTNFKNIFRFTEHIKQNYEKSLTSVAVKTHCVDKCMIKYNDSTFNIYAKEESHYTCTKCGVRKQSKSFKYKQGAAIVKRRTKTCYQCSSKKSKKVKKPKLQTLSEYINDKNCPLRIENQWTIIA